MFAGRRGVVAGAGGVLASALLPRKPLAAGLLLPDLDHPPASLGEPGVEPGGENVPAFTMRLPDGSWQTLADYAGKGVVLNLWATWCVPCVAEMPALDALAGAVAGFGVVVLPLSSDRGGAAAVQAFYASHGVAHLPVLLDPAGAAARALGVRGIPTTLLIDKAGRERGRLEGGAAWDSASAVAMVKRLAV